MSALRQHDFDAERYRRIQPTKPVKVARTTNISSRNALPTKLKTLLLIQKGSFGLAIASMSATISLYIYTVQIPKLWSQEYQQLENLQRQERQLIAINETIKYQIAREASKNGQLSISESQSALFISPKKVNPKIANKPVNQKAVENRSSLGY